MQIVKSEHSNYPSSLPPYAHPEIPGPVRPGVGGLRIPCHPLTDVLPMS